MTRKGFTLIELLVVVLIMGILASVALPQYFKSVEKSRSVEAINVLLSIADAEERHYMKTGSYVASNSNLRLLDVGISSLCYFSVHPINGNSGIYPGYHYASASRTENAGAGLGQYYIRVYYPEVPGTGERIWGCSPTTAGCNSFLPK